jgi:predicted double-glycine peptidase
MGAMVDHWVAVLRVDRQAIEFGDPAGGRRYMAHEDFERVWRHTGILVRRYGAAGGDARPARHLRTYSSTAVRGDVASSMLACDKAGPVRELRGRGGAFLTTLGADAIVGVDTERHLR